MSICIDGSTLSMLLFNHLNSCGNQYGFLLGERIEQIEDKISDSQIHSSNVSSFIYISSFIPWPECENMYSRGGCINDDWMNCLLSNAEQSLVGWYSFRHQTTLRPSLREVTLHNNLASGGKFSGQTEDFLFFLVTSSFSPNMSTHTCSHSLMHIIDRHSVKIPLTIMNLGDTTRKEYRKHSNATLSHCQTVKGSLLNSQKDFAHSSGEMDQTVKMKHLSSSINKGLMSIYNKVSESEAALGLLEVDVSNLRTRLEQLEAEEMSKTFEINAKKRKNEEEEERLIRDEKEETEEQEQLEKLLIDLGISTENSNTVKAEQSSSARPKIKDQITESFQVIVPSPSLDMDSNVHLNSNENFNTSTSLSYPEKSTAKKDKMAALKDKFFNGMKDVNSKFQQSGKEKPSDPFSFVNDEMSNVKKIDTENKRATRSLLSKIPSGRNSPTTHNNKQSSGLAGKASSSDKEQSGHESDFRSGQSVNPTKECVNGTSAKKNIPVKNAGKDEVDGAAQQSPTTFDANFTMSSSPVF